LGRSDLAAASRDTLSPLSYADALALAIPVLLVAPTAVRPSPSLLDRLQLCLRRAERVLLIHASHGMSSSKPAEFNAVVLASLLDTELARGDLARAVFCLHSGPPYTCAAANLRFPNRTKRH